MVAKYLKMPKKKSLEQNSLRMRKEKKGTRGKEIADPTTYHKTGQEKVMVVTTRVRKKTRLAIHETRPKNLQIRN